MKHRDLRPVIAALDVRDVGDLVEVTLNRPRQLNALSISMLDGLEEALELAGNRPVLLAATGPYFSSGADLNDAREIVRASGASTLVDRFRKTFEVVTRHPAVVVCELQGTAYGGGLELALACDYVVASPEARLSDFHARAGLVPGAGGFTLVASRVGLARAHLFILSGREVSAEEAFALGLVDEVVEAAADLRHAAVTTAESLMMSPEAVRMGKKLRADALWKSEQADQERQLAGQALERLLSMTPTTA